jgi:hypothetical protein
MKKFDITASLAFVIIAVGFLILVGLRHCETADERRWTQIEKKMV